MSVASPKVSLLEEARILEKELSPKGLDHMADSGEKESDGEKRFPSELAKSGTIKKN